MALKKKVAKKVPVARWTIPETGKKIFADGVMSKPQLLEQHRKTAVRAFSDEALSENVILVRKEKCSLHVKLLAEALCAQTATPCHPESDDEEPGERYVFPDGALSFYGCSAAGRPLSLVRLPGDVAVFDASVPGKALGGYAFDANKVFEAFGGVDTENVSVPVLTSSLVRGNRRETNGGYFSEPSCNRTIITGTYLRGLDFGPAIAQLPESVIRLPYGDGKTALVLFDNKGNVLAFAGGASSPKDAPALLAALEAMSVDTAFLANMLVIRLARQTRADLKSEQSRLETLRISIQSTVTSVGNLRSLVALLEQGGATMIDNMIDGIKRAGFVNVQMRRYGLLASMDDLYVNFGTHETQEDLHYVGKFECAISVDGAFAIRNVAGPFAGARHPWFSNNHACLGDYEDVIKNCILSRDWYTYGLTIIAVLTHFTLAQRYIIKADTNYKKWPVTPPKKTFCQKKFVFVYGDVGMPMFNDDEEEVDDEDDAAATAAAPHPRRNRQRILKGPRIDDDEDEDDVEEDDDDDDNPRRRVGPRRPIRRIGVNSGDDHE